MKMKRKINVLYQMNVRDVQFQVLDALDFSMLQGMARTGVSELCLYVHTIAATYCHCHCLPYRVEFQTSSVDSSTPLSSLQYST